MNREASIKLDPNSLEVRVEIAKIQLSKRFDSEKLVLKCS